VPWYLILPVLIPPSLGERHLLSKCLMLITAPHTEHPTSITTKKVEGLRKGVGDIAIKINPIPPRNRQSMIVGILLHLSRSIPKAGNAIKVKVPITIMRTAPLKEAAYELES